MSATKEFAVDNPDGLSMRILHAIVIHAPTVRRIVIAASAGSAESGILWRTQPEAHMPNDTQVTLLGDDEMPQLVVESAEVVLCVERGDTTPRRCRQAAACLRSWVDHMAGDDDEVAVWWRAAQARGVSR